MSTNDRANVLAILDAMTRIEGYTKGINTAKEFHETLVVFDATLMNFIVIGEMVDRLSADLKDRNAALDWQKIKGFRNLVAHDYFGIDAEEVWQIIHDHLPPLRMAFEKILKGLPPQ